MQIPKGHQAIMPYLILKDAAKFSDFTKDVFGAELIHQQMSEGTTNIQHAEIIINNCTIMFTDATDQWPPATANLFVYVENADDSYHKSLSLGASSVMGLSDQSYGRTCGVTDPCGNIWWITSVEKS